MSRSLDFTACDLPCKNPCWRRLTKEEIEWLEKNPNSCDEFDVCAWFKNLCDKNKFFAWSYYPYGVSR